MFLENTTFILGAGASVPYGYPTGKNLIKLIVEAIENDEIYLYLPGHQIGMQLPADLSFREFFVDKIETTNFFNTYLRYMLERFSHYQHKTGTHEQFLCDTYLFSRVKLKLFKDLKVFSKRLNEFDPISIDSFLRDHPEFAVVGKVMIGYSLMKCEDKNLFSKSYPMHTSFPS